MKMLFCLLFSAVLSGVLPAAAAELPESVYVSPGGSGSRTGADPENACASIAAAWELAAPGGTVFVAPGVYADQSLVITAGNGGREGKVKKLIGRKGADGYPRFTANWEKQEPSKGRDFIQLRKGASHIEIDGFQVTDYREGVMGFGDNSSLVIRNCDFTRIRDGIYLNGGTGIRIENCTMTGFSKRGVRLQGGITQAVVRSVISDAGGREFATEKFQMCFGTGGVKGTIDSDIRFEDCVARNAYDDAGDKYWNADGFCAEANTRSITWVNCRAFDCTDGGWDIKTRNAVLINCIALRNKRNFRIWGDAELRNCLGGYAEKRGGSGTEAGLHVCGGGRAAAVGCTFIGNAIAVDADQKGEARLAACLIAPTTAAAAAFTAETEAKVAGLDTCRLLTPEETAEALPQASAGRDGIGTAFDAPPGEKAGYRNRGTE